jgi:hypothetical protein
MRSAIEDGQPAPLRIAVPRFPQPLLVGAKHSCRLALRGYGGQGPKGCDWASRRSVCVYVVRSDERRVVVVVAGRWAGAGRGGGREVAEGMGGCNGLEAAGSSGRVSMELRARPESGRSIARAGEPCGKRASRADEDGNPRTAERDGGMRGGRGASSPLAMPICRRLAENQACSWSDKKLS